MKKVITYGTYDMLHHGHIRLLERAKALGDYLIVGITAEDFDKTRGKINVQQSLSERIEAVRNTGIADEIIVEEYEGQKIDDIRKYGVDIFTVGSDWRGHFDYLNEYCKVVYLERTKGISSTELRNEKYSLRLGIVGSSLYLLKFIAESRFCNGVCITGICADNVNDLRDELKKLPLVTASLSELLDVSDAVYIHSHPDMHYSQIKEALMRGKHVLCESPITLNEAECSELYQLAKEKKCVMVEGLRTAYATAFDRMVLLVKSGKIGEVVSVDAVCTSLKNSVLSNNGAQEKIWNSITAWGPTAMLPIFKILGFDYCDCRITSHFIDDEQKIDSFSKIDFTFPHATASIKVGMGVKSEGTLIVSGTKGYVYVPSPWWKTDYFELRYENPHDNKRYFYQLDGEGIRYELSHFIRCIETSGENFCIDEGISLAFSHVMEKFQNKDGLVII